VKKVLDLLDNYPDPEDVRELGFVQSRKCDIHAHLH
jgi:hypothetical protein